MTTNPLQDWHISRTLLGCAPGRDVNKRYLCHGTEQKFVFNEGMNVWTEADEKSLQALCAYLNSLHRRSGS